MAHPVRQWRVARAAMPQLTGPCGAVCVAVYLVLLVPVLLVPVVLVALVTFVALVLLLHDNPLVGTPGSGPSL